MEKVLDHIHRSKEKGLFSNWISERPMIGLTEVLEEGWNVKDLTQDGEGGTRVAYHQSPLQ